MRTGWGFLFLFIVLLAACGKTNTGDGDIIDSSDPGVQAGDACEGDDDCQNDTRCRFDVCIANLGSCNDSNDCPGDSYCDEGLSECIPYGVPSDKINDPDCTRGEVLDDIVPDAQCEWVKPTDPSDPTINSINIYSTPMVADLNLDKNPDILQPSVILTTWEQRGFRSGTLRIFDGRTCEEITHIGSDREGDDANRPGYGTQWAIGDMDGDVDGQGNGHPEIIGLHSTGTQSNSRLRLYGFRVAFEADGTTPKLERLWNGEYGRNCADSNKVIEFGTNQRNYGPSLFDLNNDGTPEIILDQLVFDAQGCLLNHAEALQSDGQTLRGSYNQSFSANLGPMTTVADVDLDGVPELVRGDRIAQWNDTTKSWDDEPYFNSSGTTLGHIAVVDMGRFSNVSGASVGDGSTIDNQPEIIVIDDNTGNVEQVTVRTLDGSIARIGDTEIKRSVNEGGRGGPPTAADFDGDGYVEFAAAAADHFTVYDPDCVDLSGQSNTQRPGGQCASSSTNFVLWDQPSKDESSNSTGSSVFDFNGDGMAETVYRDECYLRVYDGTTGDVMFSQGAISGTGYDNPVVVDVDGDFATEIVVVRAPRNNPSCPDEDPLFPGSTLDQSKDEDGNRKGGFVIFREPEDRWASSRPIWNQHMYSVTHVSDQAQIMSSSEWTQNWTIEGLNNFRQNVQGDLMGTNIADLTAVFSKIEDICKGFAGSVSLEVKVCNRGTNPVQDGVKVAFVEGESATTSTEICTVQTSKLLNPGECDLLSCDATISGDKEVFVNVDPDETIADCHPGNNLGAGSFSLCALLQ